MRRRVSPRWSAAALVLLVGSLAVVVSVALGAPGAFDTLFGSDGYQTVGFGGLDRATHVAIAPDGRIVLVGTTSASGSGDYAIARLTANGADDTTFQGDGQTTFGTAPGVSDVGAGVVVLADGRIVVSGQGNATQDFVTKRLGVDGSVDATFAGTGTSTVNFGGNDAENAMIAQPDGRLVLVGGTDSSGGGDFAIARLNSDGTTDTSFSGDGRQTVDFGGADTAVAVANAPGGKLVVVGQGGAGTDIVVTRLNADGSLDASFGTAGRAAIDFGGTEAGNGVVVGADGSVVVDGSTSAVGSGDVAVAKLTAAGALDPSFSGDGRTTLGYGAAGEAALALAEQQNGKLVVLGNGDPDHDFVVTRLLPDGSADAGFGTAGTMVVDFGGFEFDGDVALQPDGNIVVAGSTNVSDDGDMAVARLQGDPVGSPPAPTTTATTTPTATTPPPAPARRGPTASFVQGASLKLPGASWFSAAGSTPSPGAKLVSIAWSIQGEGLNLDTDCGASPALSTPLKKPGNFNVRLTVRDSLGLTSTSQRFVPVTKLGVHSSIKGDGIFTCENPAQGNQPSRADCIKSFGAGILDINSRSSTDECFTVDTLTSGSQTVYRGQVNGPVAINGLYVPIPRSVRSSYKSDGTIGLAGKEQVGVRVGPFLTKTFDLEKKVVPNKFGVYHLVDEDLATNTPKILGDLPVRGALAIDLAYHRSEVKVGLGLPFPLSFGAKRAAQGDAKLISDNVNGLQYDGLNIKVPDVWLGPLFVNSLSFGYQKSTNSWGGTAKVTLPGSQIALNASGPPEQPPDFGFGIKNGRFDHAGFGVDFLPPTQPDLFPPFNTVLLSHIGAAVGINPLRLTGTIGLNAAHLVEEDGVLFGVFATSGNQYTLPESVGPELAPLATRTFDRFALAIGGTAKLKVPVLGELPLLNAYGLYEYPDYFELGGSFHFGISYLNIDGSVGGFAYPTNRTFNLQGGVSACLRNIKIGFKFVKVTVSPCVNVGAVVSSKGLGFCTSIPVPVPFPPGKVPVTVGAGYRWGDRTPDLMLFSCDYGPYAEKSPLARSAQAAGGYAVNVPAGLPAAMFRVRGSGAAPDVTVTDPQGKDALGTPDAISVEGTDADTVLIGVRHPAPGRWTFTPKDGSAPVTAVAVADALAPTALKVDVGGSGRERTLSYRMNAGPGRSVTFFEKGKATARVIGTATAGTGTIRFTPGPGAGGRRAIEAVVSQAGAPAHQQQVASYVAPRPAPVRRPGRLHVGRSSGRIRISWGRSPGASRYEVLVRLADRSQVFRVVRGRHVTVADPFAAKRGTVLVDALSADGRRSAARTARLRAHVTAKRRRHRT